MINYVMVQNLSFSLNEVTSKSTNIQEDLTWMSEFQNNYENDELKIEIKDYKLVTSNYTFAKKSYNLNPWEARIYKLIKQKWKKNANENDKNKIRD